MAGIITNAATGAPLSGAIITTTDKNKTAVTNLEGDYKLVKVRTSLRQFTVTCSGYESHTLILKIVRGKVEVCNISLYSQIITLSATA